MKRKLNLSPLCFCTSLAWILILPLATWSTPTNYFTAGSGDFHDPASWSQSSIPGSGDLAVVTNTSHITISQPINAKLELTAQTTLELEAQEINATAGISAPNNALPSLTWSGGAIPPTNILLFSGATLDNVIGASATLAGPSIGGAHRNTLLPAYFFDNDGDSASFQIQFFESGPALDKFTKGVKISLTQEDDGIYGKAEYAKYIKELADMTGLVDFDTTGTPNGTNYFASSLILHRTPELKVEKTDSVPTLWHTDFITTTSTLLFPGATLANYHSASTLFTGKSFDDKYGDTHIFYFNNNGTTATFQMQRWDDRKHTKCMKIELTQEPDGIHGRAVYAKHRPGSNGYQLGHNFDLSGNINSVATEPDGRDYGCPALTLYPDQALTTYLPDTTPALLAAGVDLTLDQVTGLKAYMAGNLLDNTDLIKAQPFHWQQTSATTATVQLQTFYNNTTYCVKAEISESASGLMARALYAKKLTLSTNSDCDRRGIDFDVAGTEIPLASGPAVVGGLNVVRLEAKLAAATLAIQEENNLPGPLALNQAQLSPVNELPATLFLNTPNSSLLLNQPYSTTISGVPAGQGSLHIAAPANMQPATTNAAYNSFLPKQPDTAIILTNTKLADITDAIVYMGGSSTGGGNRLCTVQFWRSTATSITFQAYILHDVHTKCVKVRLTQQGNDIAAHSISAHYLNGRQIDGYDFDSLPSNNYDVSTGSNINGYGVMSIALITGGKPHPVTIANGVAFAGQLTLNSRDAYINAKPEFNPQPESIQVNNSLLSIKGGRGAQNNGFCNGCPLTIANRSVIYPTDNFALGMARPLTLVASECRLHTDNNGDSGQYANNLNLINGAFISGSKIRVGHSPKQAHWLIYGPTASTNAAGFTMVRYGNNPFIIDTYADFVVTGTIRDYPEAAYLNTTIIKHGTATLILKKSGSTFDGAMIINEGTVEFAVANLFTKAKSVTVNSGGTLLIKAAQSKELNLTLNTGASLQLDTPNAFAADSTIIIDGAIVTTLDEVALNTAGTTTFSGDSTIDFGTTPLTVGASSFTPGTTITLLGNLTTDTIRFTEKLSTEQLAAFVSPSGRRVWQNAEGYLRDTPRGTVFSIQ